MANAYRAAEALPRIGNEAYPYNAAKNLLDFTLRGDRLNETQVKALCWQAVKHLPAAVCVPLPWIAAAKKYLNGSPVRTTALIGLPPAGKTERGAEARGVADEAREAVAQGADEIDVALDVSMMKRGNLAAVKKEIGDVVGESQGREVKVTIQAPCLSADEISAACKIAEEAGAKFVKTDTGKAPRATLMQEVRIMRDACGIGIEIASGISTIARCRQFLKLIGPGRPVRFETDLGYRLAREEESELAGEFREEDKKLKSELFTQQGMSAFHEAEAYKDSLLQRIKDAHARGVPVVYLSVPVRGNEVASEEQNKIFRKELIDKCKAAGVEYVDPFDANDELSFLKDKTLDPILVQELMMDPKSGIWPNVLRACDAIAHDSEWKYSFGSKTEHLIAIRNGIPVWDGKSRPEIRR